MTRNSARYGAAAALIGVVTLIGCADTTRSIGITPQAGRAPNSEGGDTLLDRRAGIGCISPTTPTYECFEGKFITLAADDPAQIGTFTPPPPARREPATILYEDPGLDFSGGLGRQDVDSAPIDIAGSRISAPAMEAYLDTLLQKLLKGSPVPPPPMKVFVVGNPFYSAAAYPSGDIFVNIGLLKDAQTEDEAAAMLAHEAAHVLLAHFDRQELLDRQKDLADAVTFGASLASQANSGRISFGGQGASAGGPSLGQAIAGGGGNLDTATKAIYAVQAATFVAQDVIGSSWKRRQEDEADLLGLDLLIAAGYNVNGSLTGFQRLARAAKDRNAELERLEKRDADIQANITLDPSRGGLINMAQSVLGSALDSALSNAGDWFRREHVDPEVRRTEISGYFRREYPGPRPALTSDPFVQAKQQAQIDDIYGDYKLVADAKSALTLGDAAKASQILAPALRGAAGSDPYPRVLEAQILSSSGRYPEALAAFGKIRPGATLSLDGFLLKSDLQVRANQADQALATLDQGAALYGARHFYPARLPALAAKGDRARFETVAKACEDLDERALRTACREERKRLDNPGGADASDEVSGSGVFDSISASAGGLGSLLDNLVGQ